ncbi:MurR/RpiR family transcriptional regulator [Clostridiisalibacter paucivorans]|uniref:MurR/RpiR family transcriptional regulator n=1 Tax=Clostridiisalibacter paucivorans TaxID=408753 RepID=UPI00047EC256|nr:MurR/RpiR family transcriptional regulator [Clostridiisalibacter paucivorans]
MKENEKDLMRLIQLNFTRLSKGQKLIAEYITSHYDKAAFMTASKLGEKVGVSESTVVRFANALGFSGYPSLQKALQELIKNKLTTVQRLSLSDELSEKGAFIENILKADIENIKSTLEDIDVEVFNQVVNMICDAKRIYILGLRSSTALAGYLGFYLSLMLENVKVVSFGMSDIFEQLLRVTNDDLVIGISYPRYSRKTLEALKYVKDNNCKIVGISDSMMSPVSNMADYTLIAKSNMVSFVDSLVGPMSLINAIIISIGVRKKGELKDYFTKLEKVWNDYNIYGNRDKSDMFGL